MNRFFPVAGWEMHVQREILGDDSGSKATSDADDDRTKEDDDKLRGNGSEVDDAGVGVCIEKR